MKPTRFCVAIVLLGCAACANAHDTWLLASDYSIEPGETITLGMTSGMAFPTPDYAIEPDRVAVAKMHLAGEGREIDIKERGEHALQFEVTPQTSGVAQVRVSLAPHPIELTPEEVTHYLEEIGAPERVREAWRALPEPREWHESYTKHTVAYVRVGEPSNAIAWQQPLGLPLEFVPRQDPTRLTAGDTLELQVLKSGQPYPNFAVGVAAEGGEARLLQSDENGLVRIDITKPGRYLIRGTDITPLDEQSGEWKSHFSTLTFAVGD